MKITKKITKISIINYLIIITALIVVQIRFARMEQQVVINNLDVMLVKRIIQ